MVFSRALVLQSNQTLNCVTFSFWGHTQQQYSQGVRIAPGKKTAKNGSHLKKAETSGRFDRSVKAILLHAPCSMQKRHENMRITNPEIVDSSSTEQKQAYGALRYSKYQNCE
jgi:hypothetical protein